MRVSLVSDVHGAFDALKKVAGGSEPLLILGDLINLLDYRTNEGIIPNVLGREFGEVVAAHRAHGDYAAMRQAWVDAVGSRRAEVRERIDRAVAAEYEICRDSLAIATGYCTYGNVDNPSLLKDCLPPTMRFVDGETVEIGGMRFGFVGGGIATPMAAAGEVTDDAMERKLAALGPVDVLCSHLPPAIDALCTDVITGRRERSSRPILDYVIEYQPLRHFYGDVHQPQAHVWRVGKTLCQNVGYFRATRRPVVFEW
ncbi:MAG: metallophosphoesterase family protein [Acidimicrobiia bacterium]